MKPLTFRNGMIPGDMPKVPRQDFEILISRSALGQRVPAFLCGYVGEDGRRKRVVWCPGRRTDAGRARSAASGEPRGGDVA